MAIIKYSAVDLLNNESTMQEFVNTIADSIGDLEVGEGATDSDSYTLTSTDGDGNVTLTLDAATGDDSTVVIAAGTGITVEEADGTITITATSGDDEGNFVTVDTTSGEITDGTTTFQYLYRYLHTKFSTDSAGASFVTDPTAITATTIYVGLANRSTTTNLTAATDYNWTGYTWSSAHNMFYRKSGGNRISFLTSTNSSVPNAAPFADGDSPLDFDTLEINTGNILDNAVTVDKMFVDNLAALNANLGDIVAGTLKGGNIPDADAIPSGTEAGSFFDLSNGKFVVGDAAQHIHYADGSVTISGVSIDAGDLANLTALDGKIQGSGLQNYADSTAYDSGTLVISDDRLFESINTILATNTTNPEDDSTNWKEISADTDTDTTYTASTGITLTGTAFSVTNPFTDADETKLDGIETSATADQTDAEIVTAAGSDANLKALIDATDPVFTDTDTNTTYTASTGITLTGTAFSVTNPFTDTDETKLDGVETGATADQTDAEIVTAAGSDTNLKALIDATSPVFTDTQLPAQTQAVWNAGVTTTLSGIDPTKLRAAILTHESDTTYTAGTGLTLAATEFSVTNPFTDADETKLDGIETSATADQTDAEIVTAAGSDTNLKALIDFVNTPVFTDTQKTDEEIIDLVGSTVVSGTDITVTFNDGGDSVTVNHANTSTVNDFNDTDGDGTPDTANLGALVNRMNFDSNGHVTGYGFLSQDVDTGAVTLTVSGTNYSLDINANSVTADEIASNTITATQIAADTITANQIATDTITASEIAANVITASEIAANAITASEIAANAVTTGKLNANAVTAAKIAANTITASEIAANAIDTSELNADAVTAAKIASKTITADEIAAGTITASEIAANTITATQIAADAIDTSELNANAVTAAKIAANTITASEIAANTVTATQIAADTITATQIAANTITASEIAATTITAAEIAANTITATQIAADAITANEVNTTSLFADTAVINDITSNVVTTTNLNAQFANLGTLAADVATIGTLDTGFLEADHIDTLSLNAATITAYDDTPVNVAISPTDDVAGPRSTTGVVTTFDYRDGPLSSSTSLTAAETATWAGLVGQYFHYTPGVPADIDTYVGAAGSDDNFTLRFQGAAPSSAAEFNLASATKVSDAVVAFELGTLNAGTDVVGVPIQGTGSFPTHTIFMTYGTVGGNVTITPAQPTISGSTISGVGTVVNGDGDLFAGDAEGNHLFWDASAGVLNLRGTLNADDITSGSIDASNITITNLNASNITTGSIDADNVSVTNISADNINAGTLSVDRINGLEIAETESVGNTGVGNDTLASVSTGVLNTAFGYDVLEMLTTGSGNTAMGFDALAVTSTGGNNTAVGSLAGNVLTTGNGNSLFGNQACQGLTTGSQNSVFGNSAGVRITTGTGNTGVGYGVFGALLGNDDGGITGDHNIAIGQDTASSGPMRNLTSGSSNIGIGKEVLTSLTTGNSNLVIGSDTNFLASGSGLVVGSLNVVLGTSALRESAAAVNVIAIGSNAGHNDNTTNITQAAVSDVEFNSRDTVSFVSPDQWDIRVGNISTDDSVSYSAWTDWDDQVLVLRWPSLQSSDLQDNLKKYVSGLTVTVAIGTASAAFTVSEVLVDEFGANYLQLGAASSVVGTPATTGTLSVDFSAFTAYPVNHTECVFLGGQSSVGQPTAGLLNASSLGYNAITQLSGDNEIAIGNTSITSIKGQVAFGTYSDERDKTDFEDLDLGLDFINSLNAKKFVRNSRERYNEEQLKLVDGEFVLDENGNPEMELVFDEEAYTAGLKKDKTDTIGFKAQDIQEQLDLLDKSNYDFCDNSNPEKLNVKYGDMTAILWKAVQELSTKCDDLEARLSALES